MKKVFPRAPFQKLYIIFEAEFVAVLHTANRSIYLIFLISTGIEKVIFFLSPVSVSLNT